MMTGNANTQNTASGSRRNSRKRASVSSTSGCCAPRRRRLIHRAAAFRSARRTRLRASRCACRAGSASRCRCAQQSRAAPARCRCTSDVDRVQVRRRRAARRARRAAPRAAASSIGSARRRRANSTTCSAPSDATSSRGVPSAISLPVVHDADAIAQRVRLVHVMRGDQDRAAALAKPLEHVPQLAARLRIEAGRRLVEKQQLGLARQRARHRQPLLLPARQLRRPTRRASLRARRCRAARRPSGPSRIERSEQPQRLCDGQLVGQLRFLQLDAEPRPQRTRRRGPTAGRAPRRRRRRRAASPSRISMVVVLPAPFGPSRPKHSPRSTSRSRPSTAITIAVTLDDADAAQGNR